MIDKIEGPSSVRSSQSSQPVKRTGKAAATGSTSSASFSKHLDDTNDVNAAHGVAGAGAVSSILGVQEVDDALAHASRGKLRAEDILDRLDNLRLDLLAGGLSREKLLQLSHIANTRRGQISDPKLAGILDEIDLRAQVELAKYAQAAAEQR